MTVDERFFNRRSTPTLAEIAKLTGSSLKGDGAKICEGIAPAFVAGSAEVCFFEGNPKKASTVSTQALACITNEKCAEHLPEAVSVLVNPRPRFALALVAKSMFEIRGWASGAPPIAETAILGNNVTIGPNVVIGDDTKIGDNVYLGPNCVIGPGVEIGDNCYIGINASIICSILGRFVNVGSGSRIGEPGFGITHGPEGAEEIPQLGRVIIGDHVRIGANNTIDRGAFEDTIMGDRCKLDNLCLIAHNVVLGKSVIIAGLSGMSGSVKVGDGVMTGGHVGVANHFTVGENTILAGYSGVIEDVPDNVTWGGIPARPVRQWLKEMAWLKKQVMPSKKKQ